ncbi:N-acetylmuramoyl-L-alanine amidase [Nocardia sp. CNY236]|uniref:N-acetylmuramoyl-L-alanine amidase n=1 Tax=Nocardia sp. CNY236 TaxID=1169152 RepID=UPI001E3EB17C|nr:N-acetylmuramoyl-L-alanine amidase [Nocardia sp. CNY236]
MTLAAPLAALTLDESGGYRVTTNSEPAAVSAQLAEIALASAPDIVLPLRELTGLDLPDLRLTDLRMLAAPESLPAPGAMPVPPAVHLPDDNPVPEIDAGRPFALDDTRDRMVTTTAPPVTPTTTAPPVTPVGEPLVGFVADPDRLRPGITPDTPALAPGAVSQDLLGRVGTQVKELSSDTPFSMVALTGETLDGTTATIRARQPDGTWGAWFDSEPVGTHGAVLGTDGTEPIYVGSTNKVQVLVTRKIAPEPTPVAQAVPGTDTTQPVADLTAVLIDPGRGPVDGLLHEVAVALPGGGPTVITRTQWGADEALRCEEPTYDDGLGGVTVHHTAGRNDYSKSESAGIVRAIYTYHAKTLGWCDIGYHALVDRFGQIFEGRFGGLDRPVQGAHTGGFNENTAGIALMGNYESTQPTNKTIDAVGALVGWRTKVAGLDPKGYTTMYSEGTSYTPYARGAAVRLPIVFAHRDVGKTSCPGDAAYAQMDRIRDIAAGAPGASGGLQNSNFESDLAALAELTVDLLNMVHDSIIAEYWSQSGGPAGPLGAARSEVLPAAQGQQYAEFADGHLYTAPDGQVVAVLGAIRDRFVQLGADTGALGLPLRDAYPVPDGLRAEFQHGSLILDRLTGIITTVWNTDGHDKQPNHTSHG